VPLPDDDPVPSDAEVAQLLDTVNQVLAVPLTRDRPGRRLRGAAAPGAAGVGGGRAGVSDRPALERVAAPGRLVARYGTEAPVVEALGPAAVVAGRPETVVELRFAVRYEGARTVADLLDRRTRFGLVPADRARAVPIAEQVLAEEP
jgi:glycerol-3-phosphate dehydrogenase